MKDIWNVASNGTAWLDVQIDEEVDLKYLAVKLSEQWYVVRQMKVDGILVESKTLDASFKSLEEVMNYLEIDIAQFKAQL